MRSFFIITFFLLKISIHAKSQSAYNIVYEYLNQKETFERDHNGFLKAQDKNNLRLIVNDSISFWYIIIQGKDLAKKNNNIYGNKSLPHATFYDKKSDKSLSVIDLKGEDKYLKENSAKEIKWIDALSNKDILGFFCKSVYSVNENNDSILVYYTDSVNINGSPLHNYNQVKGLVLEVFDQERKLHLVAKSLKECDCKIIIPQNLDVVNEEQNKARINKFRAKRNLPPFQ